MTTFPWLVEFDGSQPLVSNVDVCDQLIILSATLARPASHQLKTSAVDTSNNLHYVVDDQRLLLCADVTPADFDVAHDCYCAEPARVILCSFAPETSMTKPVKLAVRPGSVVTLSLVSPTAISAELLSNLKVTCTGVKLVDLPPPSGWRPVIQNKWFIVKPTVRSTTIISSPPHILAPNLRAGNVGEVRCVSSCSRAVRWANGVVSPFQEVEPYRKLFTPARADKIVRIRRFHHRNADIIGEVAFGEQKTAIGQAQDEASGDLYVCWETGGWSRLNGSEGPFLLEHRTASCQVFPQPKLFTSAREGRGVRVRAEPKLSAKQIGLMEPNEVREAIALHCDEHNNQFVEWKSGGFSCVASPHGSFLIEIVPISQTLRQTPLRATKGPPSPEIVAFDRQKRPRENTVDEDSGSDDSCAKQCRPRHRTSSPPNVGISPGLIPESLKQSMSDGKVSIHQLPEVSLRGDDDTTDSSEYDDDDEEGDDEEEVDWSDEEGYSSDDYDEDAVDEDADE